MNAIERLRELEQAATPGPWVRGWWSAQAEDKCDCSRKGPLLAKRAQSDYPDAGPYHVHQSDFFPDDHALSGQPPDCIEVAGNCEYEEGGIVSDADAALIAASRNLFPLLLDLWEAAHRAAYGSWGIEASQTLRDALERLEAAK